jgi:hypothetical protein
MAEFARRMGFKVGSVIRHFKRETVDLEKYPNAYLYEIIAFANHSETNEPLVVYKALYSSEGWGIKKEIPEGYVCARPAAMFFSEVDHEKYPDIKQKHRFELADSEYKLPEVHTHELTYFYMNRKEQ